MSLIGVGVDALQQRQTERGSLSGAGLCQSDHITLLVEEMGYHHLLYRHRVLEAEFIDGFEKFGSHTELFECGNVIIFVHKFGYIS